jgi:hypothetical protein
MTRHYQFGDKNGWMKKPTIKYETPALAYFGSRQSGQAQHLYTDLILYVYEDDNLIRTIDTEPLLWDTGSPHGTFQIFFDKIDAYLNGAAVTPQLEG